MASVLPAKVSKALLVVNPGIAESTSFTQALRFKLYEEGFIVVREEHRSLNHELTSKLVSVGGFESHAAGSLVGDVYLFVVAASDAAEKLCAFVARSDDAIRLSVSVPTKQANASKAVNILFPAMATDNIPSNGEAREYVQEELKGLLLSGLTELAKQRPSNPIEWLAHYLLDNNPHSPPVTLANSK
eukprot:CAMPEP_0176429242 /NCGR_PEP_ID=MMETSP0127-20121128/13605_1 /TAXON_ID=938130 /ORGANISM="Platyophrya macrostoma, Strain WH" /LENGTH=186 /DNA_ID=CAMNT_0017811031 /DNA_START=68 /DNA_END=628 /DNA_ORIENTATION=-